MERKGRKEMITELEIALRTLAKHSNGIELGLCKQDYHALVEALDEDALVMRDEVSGGVRIYIFGGKKLVLKKI